MGQGHSRTVGSGSYGIYSVSFHAFAYPECGCVEAVS